MSWLDWVYEDPNLVLIAVLLVGVGLFWFRKRNMIQENLSPLAVLWGCLLFLFCWGLYNPDKSVESQLPMFVYIFIGGQAIWALIRRR